MSLFARLLRYRPSEHRTPEEDFFTEIVAAVLRHHPEVFWDWLSPGWAAYESSDDIDVRTQVWKPKLDGQNSDSRVDLVFERRQDGVRDVAYIESKIASEEGKKQLVRYAAHLCDERESDHRLLVYATRDYDAKETPKEGDYIWRQTRWLDFYRVLESISSPLVHETQLLMKTLRMDDSRALTPSDLFVAGELTHVLRKFDDVLAQVGGLSLYDRVNIQKRWTGASLPQLLEYRRYMLIVRTSDRLWAGEATKGMDLMLGFELDPPDGVPTASIFLEIPNSVRGEKRKSASTAFAKFAASREGEGWKRRDVEQVYEKLARARTLAGAEPRRRGG